MEATKNIKKARYPILFLLNISFQLAVYYGGDGNFAFISFCEIVERLNHIL